MHQLLGPVTHVSTVAPSTAALLLLLLLLPREVVPPVSAPAPVSGGLLTILTWPQVHK